MSNSKQSSTVDQSEHTTNPLDMDKSTTNSQNGSHKNSGKDAIVIPQPLYQQTAAQQVSAFKLKKSLSSDSQQGTDVLQRNDNILNIHMNNNQHQQLQNIVNYLHMYQLLMQRPTLPEGLAQTQQTQIQAEVDQSPKVLNGQENLDQTEQTLMPAALPEMNKSQSAPNQIKKSRICNCKKTKCLKLYCDCFAAGELCGSECNCTECSNNQQNLPVRAEAIQAILEKNPYSFNSKSENEAKVKKQPNKNGCNCRKSGCLKKYCCCYNNGLKCSENCKCTECQNLENPKKVKLNDQSSSEPGETRLGPEEQDQEIKPEQIQVSAATAPQINILEILLALQQKQSQLPYQQQLLQARIPQPQQMLFPLQEYRLQQ